MTTPSGPAFAGDHINIHIAERAGAAMREQPNAELIPDVGIRGDRYATGLGHYSHRRDIREVTLIEIETLEALQRDHGITLRPHQQRRNLTTRGVPLNHLVGRTFSVGDTVLLGGRLNTPCTYLEDLLDIKVHKPLIHRSGLNCTIISGGIIQPGDPIAPTSDTPN